MRTIISKVIDKYGVRMRLKSSENPPVFKGIIIPARNLQKSGGGIGHSSCLIADPHQYYIYAPAEFLTKAARGDIISDGKNEYYILWTDEYKSCCGNYTKIKAVLSGGN